MLADEHGTRIRQDLLVAITAVVVSVQPMTRQGKMATEAFKMLVMNTPSLQGYCSYKIRQIVVLLNTPPSV